MTRLIVILPSLICDGQIAYHVLTVAAIKMASPNQRTNSSSLNLLSCSIFADKCKSTIKMFLSSVISVALVFSLSQCVAAQSSGCTLINHTM